MLVIPPTHSCVIFKSSTVVWLLVRENPSAIYLTMPSISYCLIEFPKCLWVHARIAKLSFHFINRIGLWITEYSYKDSCFPDSCDLWDWIAWFLSQCPGALTHIFLYSIVNAMVFYHQASYLDIWWKWKNLSWCLVCVHAYVASNKIDCALVF